jgi:hypothetical protein
MKVSPFDKDNVEKQAVGKNKSELETREEAQELITLRREEETMDLVMGRHAPIPLRYLFFPLMGVVLVVGAVFSGLSLMPQHDMMKEPGYWSVFNSANYLFNKFFVYPPGGSAWLFSVTLAASP